MHANDVLSANQDAWCQNRDTLSADARMFHNGYPRSVSRRISFGESWDEDENDGSVPKSPRDAPASIAATFGAHSAFAFRRSGRLLRRFGGYRHFKACRVVQVGQFDIDTQLANLQASR